MAEPPIARHELAYEPAREGTSRIFVRVTLAFGIVFSLIGLWMLGMWIDKAEELLSPGISASGFGITLITLSRILLLLEVRNEARGRHVSSLSDQVCETRRPSR